MPSAKAVESSTTIQTGLASVRAVDVEPAGSCEGRRNPRILPVMAEGQRQQAEWQGLRLVVEARPTHWQVFVYDAKKCEVLHTEEQATADGAKCAALEVAVAYLYGPGSDLKPEVLAGMLEWEPY